jgi:hypothetical protein
MADNDIFAACERSASDYAGVFEYTAGTGYFYLHEPGGKDGQRIIDHIWVVNTPAGFGEADVTIRWDARENRVGLFIRERLWAVFDLTINEKFGGGYKADADADIPEEIMKTFFMH